MLILFARIVRLIEFASHQHITKVVLGGFSLVFVAAAGDFLNLVGVRWMVVRPAGRRLQFSVEQNATRPTPLVGLLFGIVVAAPVATIAANAVAIVHVPVQHKTRSCPRRLNERQFSCAGKRET